MICTQKDWQTMGNSDLYWWMILELRFMSTNTVMPIERNSVSTQATLVLVQLLVQVDNKYYAKALNF